ncbi:uncharacterized protein LOC130808174 [Amaranthus tricolor]|uniref:uncharacterized protein LOC130808174 n=1 Tax=Amaranthus tricolor TaxID=29722 RepID=UPI002590369B|nr:uncharacterized protein LOC130808174 [Amaranthus tricolor]XP_057529622.1 uncharacterized protein LOC130808174 [Amaranthus tricolor]XP_057529623.1 uncharacterized protein LOC130808174 [Amaranthus tricolor]XP_057529624.1 uncharacterized protein LOC130808174 [Amaranthus tricolor]
MRNAYMSRFCSIHYTAVTPLLSHRKLVLELSRDFSSCSSLIVAPSSSPICNRSLLVLTAQISLSDTTQRSEEWFALRKDKLTTSTFSTALGFWKGTRRAELWAEKVFASVPQCLEASSMRAMEWGVVNESVAVERYKSITGQDVSFMGFAIHAEPSFNWVGASPDGLLSCSPEDGILEVKCPYNKGKPELALPWSKMPFYYMPQIQGQMEIMDREWVDLYCWTPNGSSIFKVRRDRGYWDLIHGILHEFWWGNVIPAREALTDGGEEAANYYKPAPKHRKTGEVVAKSIRLAAEAKLLCKEIAGHIEFCT